jgi:methylmalonyl-CoA mutase N-terminal domain/subunit
MTSTRELTTALADRDAELERLRAEVAEWRRRYEKAAKRETLFVNSADEVAPVYTALDVADRDPAADGTPGAYPYTRGIHPTGYRGKLWTMRQFAGFGSARDTNERFKFLLSQGQTGALGGVRLPHADGLRRDHPRSEGEVGKTGVSISSLADMETLFDGDPARQGVSTS